MEQSKVILHVRNMATNYKKFKGQNPNPFTVKSRTHRKERKKPNTVLYKHKTIMAAVVA